MKIEDLKKKFKNIFSDHKGYLSDKINSSEGLFDCSLMSLFISDKIFNIPNFQRQFVWKEINIENFFTTFNIVTRKSPETYFLGFFILKKSMLKEDKKSEDDYFDFSIIDGQQRIMTTYIMLIVLKVIFNDLSLDKKNKEDKQKYLYLSKLINDDFLLENSDLNPKLKIRYELDEQGLIIKEFAENKNLSSHSMSEEFHKLSASLKIAFIYTYTWLTGVKWANDKLTRSSGNKYKKIGKNNFEFLINGSNDFQKNLANFEKIIEVLKKIKPSLKIPGDDLNESDLFSALNSTNRPLTNFELIKNHLYSKLLSYYDGETLQRVFFSVIEKNCKYDSDTLEQFFQIWYQDYFNKYDARTSEFFIYRDTVERIELIISYCNVKRDVNKLDADYHSMYLHTESMIGNEKEIERFILHDVILTMVTISWIINDLFIPGLDKHVTTSSLLENKIIDLTRQLFILRALNTNNVTYDYFDEENKDEISTSEIKLNKSISPLVIRLMVIYYSTDYFQSKPQELNSILKVIESYIVRRRVLHQKDGDLTAMPTRFYNIFFKKKKQGSIKIISDDIWKDNGILSYFDVYYYVLFDDFGEGKKAHNWLAPTPETFKFLKASIKKKNKTKDKLQSFSDFIELMAPKSYNSKNTKEIKIFLMIEHIINFDFEILAQVFCNNSNYSVEHFFPQSIKSLRKICKDLNDKKKLINQNSESEQIKIKFKNGEINKFCLGFGISYEELLNINIKSILEIEKEILVKENSTTTKEYDEEIWRIGNLQIVRKGINSLLGSMPIEAKSLILNKEKVDFLENGKLNKDAKVHFLKPNSFNDYKFSKLEKNSISLMEKILNNFAPFEKKKIEELAVNEHKVI